MMRGVNLIPAYRQTARQSQRRMRGWIKITTAYAALALAVCAGIRLNGGNSDIAIGNELQQYQQHIDQLNASVVDLRKQLTESETARQSAIAISDQPDWSILFSILSTSIGDEVVLRDVQLRPDHTAAAQAKSPAQQHQLLTLQMHGFAKSQPAVSQLVLRLQQLGLFDDVKLVRTGREAVENIQAVSFDITCSLSDTGGSGRRP